MDKSKLKRVTRRTALLGNHYLDEFGFVCMLVNYNSRRFKVRDLLGEWETDKLYINPYTEGKDSCE